MNILLWIVQVFLAVQFLWHGMFFISPPPEWADAIKGMGLPTWFRQSIGVAEVLAAIGLVLPGVTRILTGATPLAFLGLSVVMASATVYHVSRQELPNAISAANLLVLVAVAGYVRWKGGPHPGSVRSMRTEL